MSYILDALKQAEQQRPNQTESAQPLAPQHYPPQARQSSAWKILLVIIFILNIGIAAILFWPKPPQTPVIPKAPTPVTITPNPPPVLTPIKAPPAKIIIDPMTAPAIVTQPPRPVKPVVNIKTPPVKEEILTSIEKIQPPPIIEHPIPPQAKPPIEYHHIPILQEKSPEFQQSLPSLRITVYVYHQQPKRRFVLIDSHKYQEGQTINGGPVLEAITPDSLILHKDGDYFRIIRP